MSHGSMSAAMSNCIEACHDCAASCAETTRHCLEMGGEHATAAHILALIDCADICETSASFMARGSDLFSALCATCADACDRCAEECERFPDDERMARCAQICRQTAESCRAMAGAAA